MYALKWLNLSRTQFLADGDGGGSEAAPAPAGGDGGGGSAGGNSAPSAPSSSPDGGTPSPDSGAPSSFDWSALGTSDDLDYHAVEVPTEPTPAQPVPKPEEPPVPQPTPPAQPVPPQPQEPPPPTAAQPQPSPEAARPLSAAEPWRIAEGLEANRDAVIAHLAQSKFALSEEDIKDLDTDVTVAVPKFLARVFLESQVSMQKFLAQAVPGMVKQYNTVASANTRAEDQFFAAHKALDVNNPQHRATAVRIATVYRQANPDIPLNQLIQEVGPMVMAALRMNAPQVATPPGGTPLPRTAGAASAFRPAVNGGGGVSPSPAPSDPWSGLGRNFDE